MTWENWLKYKKQCVEERKAEMLVWIPLPLSFDQAPLSCLHFFLSYFYDRYLRYKRKVTQAVISDNQSWRPVIHRVTLINITEPYLFICKTKIIIPAYLPQQACESNLLYRCTHMCILLFNAGRLRCKLWTSGWFPPLDQLLKFSKSMNV